VDASGNAYITGITYTSDYPIITGAYQTANGGGSNDAFVTKLKPDGSALVYSTFIGGNSGDYANSIAIDAGGNVYLTGVTSSNNYPTTGGAYQTTLNGSQNAFVTELNSTGSALVYSTYVGGNSYDAGNKILVDASGNSYVAGQTSSSNFPTTGGAYQTAYGGGSNDVFVTKLNSSGSALVYSTFIGGNDDDEGNSLAIDASGNAYVTGQTASSNFPATGGAYQTAFGGGGYDAFVTKLKPDGSGLVYSTFIGGNVMDKGYSITIDAGGNSYITGSTSSSNYPATGGAYQTAKAGTLDAFVTKLNSGGTALVYSTFIGGNNTDVGESIAADADGNAYITGYTFSSDYPTTTGAYQTAFGGNADVFASKINSNGSALIYSTYIGANGFDIGYSSAIDAGRNVYLTGYSSLSTAYPTTPGAYQTNFSGTVDVFVTKLDLNSLLPPDVVQQAGPVSGSIGLIKPILLKWTSSARAATYRLQISTDNTFATTTADIPGLTDITYSAVSNLSNQTTYYWRVNATNGGGTSAWSAVWSFKTLGNPTKAELVYPSANSTNIPVTVNFQWNQSVDQLRIAAKNGNPGNAKSITAAGTPGKKNVSGVSQYLFQLMADTNSTSYVVNDPTLTNTTETVSGLNNSTAYWWRVRALNEVGWGDYTNWSKFTTIIDTPDVVQQLSPINGSAGNKQPALLKWKNSARTSTYRLQFSTDSAFITVITDTTGLTDTTYSAGSLSNLATYYWRVNATNAGGTSSWSPIWSFKTLGSPTQAVLVYPSANSINIPLIVNFQWNKSEDQLKLAIKNGNLKNANGKKNVASVSSYWFELTKDTTSTNYIAKDSLLADTTKSVSGLTNLTNYWWRVRALNEAGWGSFTGWNKFTTAINTPDIVQQAGPINNSVGSIQPVRLKWISSSRASNYRLQYSTDSTFATITRDTLGLTDTAFTVSGLSNLTTYYWRVNATNAGGSSNWSTIWNFKTLGSPTQALLIYPSANSINIPVTVNFQWNHSEGQQKLAIKNSNLKNANNKKNIAGVSRYWFELMADTTSTSYIAKDSTLADTTKTISGLTNLTSYWWRVRALNETGWGDYTGWSKFTTVIESPDVVHQLSPVNGSAGNTQPVKLKWTSSARAANYRLQFGIDSTFSTITRDTLGLTDTSYTVIGLNNLTTYYWRVNSINAGGSSNWSSVWNFKMLGSPTQAVLVYPTANSVDIPVTVNFQWNKSVDQLVIKKSGTSGKKNVANVNAYWLELTVDTTGNNYTANDSTLVETSKAVSGLQNLTNYWWRVSAKNETGWGSFTGWSKFTTIIDTPGVAVLLSPGSSANVSDTTASILFTWKGAAYASSYRIQIASDSKFSKIIADTTGITDTVFTYQPKNLSSTFYWRVQGNNIAGTGSWSSAMSVSAVTGINNNKGLPVVYALYQNYPNPFNPSSRIRFALPFNSNIKIEVYNILGKKVQELLNEQKSAGYYEVNFKTTGLASGVYFYMIEAKSIDGKNEYRETKKMLLLK